MKSKVVPRNPSPNSNIRFDPLDADQVRLLLRLLPGERIRVTSVDAQALAKGLIWRGMGRGGEDSRPLHL